MGADISTTKKYKSNGARVIEKNLKVKHILTNSIINYICILPKFQRKGFGTYFMVKVLQSDAQLDCSMM